MRSAIRLMAVIAATLAAGCFEPEPPASVPSEPSGTLVLRIVDTELLPLDQARVWVDGVPVAGTSDAAGLVVVDGAKPGQHEVRANRTGYWDNNTKVTVVENETTEVWMEMERVPGPRDVWEQDVARPYCGFVLPTLPEETEPRCRSPPLASGPRATFAFEGGVRTVILRMYWEASSDTSARMVFNVSLRDATFANGSEFFIVEGSSPVDVRMDGPLLSRNSSTEGGNLTVLIRTPDSEPTRPFVDQTVEVKASFLYRVWPDLSRGPGGS